MKIIKSIFFLLAISVLLASCCKSSCKKNAENEQLVKQYFQLFNAHKWKELSELYIENAEFKDPSLGTGIVKQSKQDFIKKYAELNQVFPDIKDRVLHVYPSDNKNIIVEFVSTGTAPDQSKFELPISTIFTIENGKITKDYTYYDNFEEANK